MKTTKYRYVAIKKEDNSIVISNVKTIIARFLNISDATILRHEHQSVIEHKNYTIYIDVEVVKLKRGNASNFKV